MANDNNQFNYKYTALTDSERKLVESIRSSYEDSSEASDKLTKLKKLDKKVKTFPKWLAVFVGIVGVLVMGLGMSLVMVWNILGWGIAVGISGAIIATVAYPIYSGLIKKGKRKYGKQITELSQELLSK